jgi:hypothetical protein
LFLLVKVILKIFKIFKEKKTSKLVGRSHINKHAGMEDITTSRRRHDDPASQASVFLLRSSS